MPDMDQAPPGANRWLNRWLSRLLPLLLFGVLVFTPLVIWLIKQPEPVFEQVRIGGRVAEVAAPPPGNDASALVTVELSDGARVVVRGGARAPEHGAEVTLIRTVFADGAVSHELADD